MGALEGSHLFPLHAHMYVHTYVQSLVRIITAVHKLHLL